MNDCKWRRNRNALKTSKQSDLMKEGRKVGQKLKPRETEEAAAIRRFHDAQRMARFRARKRKALEEAKALEARKITELSVISLLKRRNISFRPIKSTAPPASAKEIRTRFPVRNSTSIFVHPVCEQSKYSQLLTRIRELGKDIKLTYAGSRISAERLKIGIIKARMLIKECLMETNEMNLQQ